MERHPPLGQTFVGAAAARSPSGLSHPGRWHGALVASFRRTLQPQAVIPLSSAGEDLRDVGEMG